ncbi:MAG: CHAT domain-containing protein [Nitrospirae bacterium]|nr:MAG: CHAT domain-containing protein [Nitrospirota bacterium]
MNRFQRITLSLLWSIWALAVWSHAAPLDAEHVTSHPALEYFPAPSGDGRFLAFVSERTGNADIWLKSLARGAIALPRRLTDHPAIDRDPALSDDGRRLLYVSHKTDPRGDVYMLDVITGSETRLTDRTSGEAFPQWDPDGNAFFYLKQPNLSDESRLYHRSLGREGAQREREILTGVTSFSVSSDGWIVYSNGRGLRAVHRQHPDTIVTLTDGPFLDLWPRLAHVSSPPNGRRIIAFARYERDTNRDGTIDTDDESSIWLGQWTPPTSALDSLYRLTPTHNFHLYPAQSGGFVYFTDLKQADILRLHLDQFLQDYTSFETAYERALLHMDQQRPELGMLMLTNISRNLTAQLGPDRRAAFDFEYIEHMIQAKDYPAAEAALTPYLNQPGPLGARARIYQIVLDLRQRADTLSARELARTVARGVAELLAIGEQYRTNDVIYGQALIEAGRLHFLTNDFLSALDYLVKVNALSHRDIRARALFIRALAYQQLGDETNLLQVFIDVIRMFGEDSSWGKRAIAQAIAVSERGTDIHEHLARLWALVERYPDLPYLSTATQLRIAALYNQQGEQAKALRVLDQLLAKRPPFLPLLERAYRRKAQILSAAERYREAAEAYAALAKLTGQEPSEYQDVQRLMILQLVKKALKDRRIGEVRIAAKGLRRIIDEYPHSVEGHRGYIETKVMLDELDEVLALYDRLLTRDPDNAVYLYGKALALSYVQPPNLPTVIDLIEQAIERNPEIPYFHQTLGWAYEQQERLHGAIGFLEKAEAEYQIALRLNDGFLFPDVESHLLLNLGNVYLGLKNYHEAYRHYRQRETVHQPTGRSPTELLYRKHYGEACFKTGRSEEAIAQFRLALRQVPDDQPALKAELWERIGLAQQDLGAFADAVQSFSHALALNLEIGNRKNLALLQRNIGVNLYHLSTSTDRQDRTALKKALRTYFAALKNLEQFGERARAQTAGLFTLELALGEGGSEAASGFDLQGEKKLMFSYIARTYEQLQEPAAAREFYLKKLALLGARPDEDTDVARLAEKAVVLNRLGVLAYAMRESETAIDYTRQSLGYTQSLELSFGTAVNLYNLSRLLAEQLIAGIMPDLDFVTRLVTGLDEQLATTARPTPSLLFYTLANIAFLLHHYPEVSSAATAQETVQRWHTWYRLKRRAWSYYATAKELLADHRVSLNGHTEPMRFLLTLNMLELARESGKHNLVRRLQHELASEIQRQSTPYDWLWFLAQAEHADEWQQQESWLRQAIDALMAHPPQAFPKSELKPTLAAIDQLSRLSVDALVRDRRYADAFIVSQQLLMRKLATELYLALGEDLFLAGLGEYEAELRPLLAQLRAAMAKTDHAQVEESAAQIEEILYALYEEHPRAVSYFWQYPLTADILSSVLNPQHPCLAIVQGRERRHGFIHDGTQVQYVPWPVRDADETDSALSEAFAAATAWYVSGIDSTDITNLPSFIQDKPVTRVASAYDFMNGYHERSLFANTITISGSPLDLSLPSQQHAVTVRILQPDLGSLHEALATTDIFVATKPVDPLAFELRRDLNVRDMIRVTELAGTPHHTALVRLSPSFRSQEPTVLAVALIRAGFPHVILDHGSHDERLTAAFLSQYVAALSDLPADAAVAKAEAALFGIEHRTTSSFHLYGYAGMTKAERRAFASGRYNEEVSAAVTHYRQEAWSKALHHIEHALAVIDEAGHMHEFTELTKLAVDAAFKLGDYARAVTHQQRLLGFLEQAGDPDGVAEAQYRLGILYSRLEHFDRALNYLQAAIEYWTQSDELDRLAEGIATMGIVRENMGAYTDALADFLRSFELYQEMGEIEDVAAQYRRIGRIYYLRLNRYERARQHLTAALDIYRDLGDRRGEAETILDIGLTFEKTGLFDEADRWYRQGQTIAEELHDPFLLATAFLYQANTAWFRGNYQKAFELLSVARTFAEDAKDLQLTIMITNTRGLLYWTLNDTDKALHHLKEAVTLAEQADIKTELASSLNNLGLVYRQRGEYATALTYFEQARHIDEALKSRWGLGYDHRNIGMALFKLNKLQEAEQHFLDAERISAEIKNVTNWVKALLELGNVNRALERFDSALTYYERAYALAQRYGIREVEWRAAQGKARLLRSTQPDEAFRWYATAVDVVESMRATLKIEELRNSFQSNKLDLYRETISLLVDMGRTDDAFNYLERSRSRSFIDLLGNQKLTLKSETDQRTLETIASLSQQLTALKRELASYDEAPPPDVLGRYKSIKAQYDEAIIELKQQNPALSTFVTVDPLTLPAIQQLLDPTVGLLSYMLTEDRVFIWLIRTDATRFYQVPVGEAVVTTLVRRFRQSVQHLEPVDEELRQLERWLIQPVNPDLAGLAYLGIIPDGPLHFLAFSALHNGQAYLIERYPLFYTPSASVLKFTFAKRRDNASVKVLAIGNPDLGNFNYDLPLAELEAKSIRWNYPDMDILTGPKATKEWFVQNISRYGIIHVAAHGEFDEINPLFSSLWLASEQPDNRRLTVTEIFGLEINADLVTLSACQTGLGKLEAGELIGLNRAFMYAGTHALISALWRVDDLSTSVLMKHFYRHYGKLDKAKSLRQAQLIVKQSFPHPSYWAGFNLVGDYR